MSDLISRAAAINEIARWIGYLDDDMIGRIQFGLKRLPSAQTEIIRCKDCRKNPNWEWVGCPMTGKDTRKPDDFCSYAERKSNG